MVNREIAQASVSTNAGTTDLRLSHELMLKHNIVYRKPKHSLSDKQDDEDVDQKKRLLEFLKKTQ